MVSPYMTNPFAGLQQGMQAAGGLIDMYNAPRDRAFAMEQARQKMALEQAQLGQGQQRIDLATREQDRLAQASQREQAKAQTLAFGRLAKIYQTLPEEEREQFLMDTKALHGLDPNDVSESMIKNLSASYDALGSMKGQGFQKGKTVLVDTGEGLAFATSSYDPNTQKTETSLSPIKGTLVSELGETRQDQMESRTKEARSKAQAAGLGKAQAESAAELTSNGLEAADGMAIVSRGLELLNEVKTGGIDAVKLKAKQLVGAEGADEAELSFNLAKNVLQQLRPTFGAAFTKAEKDSLDRIEAGISKSTEGNKRLLSQALKIFDRAARRGIRAGEKAGLDFEVDEIKQAMNFDLTPTEQPKPDPYEGKVIQNAQGEKLIRQSGQWVPYE